MSLTIEENCTSPPEAVCNIETISAYTREGIPADNEERRDLGRKHMARVVIYWLNKNDWSHPNIEALAQWALNEEGALHTSQISHIRNQRMRMLGVKSTDALATINLAIWAYQNNRRDLLKKMGTSTLTPALEDLIKNAVPILDPVTGCPLDVGGFINLYLGYKRLPSIIQELDNAPDFSKINDLIGPYIFDVVAAAGKNLGEARDLFAKAVTADQAARYQAIAAQMSSINAKDLGNEINAICLALEQIDGKKRTAAEIVDEIAAR